MPHKKRISGWTAQESRCDFAVWWDCSYLCTNKEITKGNKLFPCKFNFDVPNYEECVLNEIFIKKIQKYNKIHSMGNHFVKIPANRIMHIYFDKGRWNKGVYPLEKIEE